MNEEGYTPDAAFSGMIFFVIHQLAFGEETDCVHLLVVSGLVIVPFPTKVAYGIMLIMEMKMHISSRRS